MLCKIRDTFTACGRDEYIGNVKRLIVSLKKTTPEKKGDVCNKKLSNTLFEPRP